MNKELEKIFKEDQCDRLDPNISLSVVIRRDKDRLKKVKQLINNKKIITKKDYYNIAMIFHHSQNITYIKKANMFALKSAKMGYKKAKWLCAATLDRLLMTQGKKQKFGTQFIKKSLSEKWSLYPVDLKTTDEERALYNVLPLEKTKKLRI